MSFPPQHRTKLHSTNPLGRLNGEIKRRTEVVGIFPNEEAIPGLAGATLLEQNDVYGPPHLARLLIQVRRARILRSCIRPGCAATRAAGPYGFRGSTAGQMDELKMVRIISVTFPDPR